MTKDLYEVEGENLEGEAITLRDLDLDGEKSKVLRTNLDVTRFFYVSDDSLFSQGVDVFDHRFNKTAKYKVWQSRKDNPIPIELEKHGIHPIANLSKSYQNCS